MVTHPHSENKSHRYPVADRERGALRRLEAIMAKYPQLRAYHQSDPRGCAVYVGLRADMGGPGPECNYTSGVAVCY